ncbi:MAG: hydrogen peroxide-inducible genes activator OxyR [Candidatus Velthaea sp.]
MLMFELRDLQSFLALAETRNFSRAAERLGIAQPPLSRRIAALEAELGVLLVSREKRQIELTAAGEAFAREARVILAQADLAAAIAREAARGARGHVRLGYVGSTGYDIVPNAIRGFREQHHDATVTLTELLGARQIAALRAGTIDVALIRGPVESGEFAGRRLRADRLVAALPAGHALAARATIRVADLAHEPFVAFNRYGATGLHDLVRGVCAHAGFVPRVVQEVDALDTLLACVAAGIGVALTQDLGAQALGGGAVMRPLRPAAPPVELTAVWRADDANSLVPVLVDQLARAAG